MTNEQIANAVTELITKYQDLIESLANESVILAQRATDLQYNLMEQVAESGQGVTDEDLLGLLDTLTDGDSHEFYQEAAEFRSTCKALENLRAKIKATSKGSN